MTTWIRAVCLGVWLVAVGGVFALGWRMVAQAEDLSNHPLNRRIVSAPRGSVLDAHGSILAHGPINQRRYELGAAGLHPIGFAIGVQSRSGLEKRADAYLSAPAAAVLWHYFDRRQEERPRDLQLTIESSWQRAAYDALGGRRGAFVLIDASNGQIVASASSPGVDPEHARKTRHFKDIDQSPWFDRAMSGRYLPGSTFKLWTAVTVIERGAAAEQVQCPGHVRVGRRVIRCMGVHGSIELARALQVSCNVYFVTQALRTESDAWLTAAERGLGTNFRRPAKPPSNWNRALMAIGQGEAKASPVAMAAAMATLYTDQPEGTTISPSVVLRGPIETMPAVRPVMVWTSSTRAAIRDLLARAGGSAARRAELPAGWALLGAKTGTAQRPGVLGDVGWLVGALRDPMGRVLGFALAVEGVRSVSLHETPPILGAAARAVMNHNPQVTQGGA